MPPSRTPSIAPHRRTRSTASKTHPSPSRAPFHPQRSPIESPSILRQPTTAPPWDVHRSSASPPTLPQPTPAAPRHPAIPPPGISSKLPEQNPLTYPDHSSPASDTRHAATRSAPVATHCDHHHGHTKCLAPHDAPLGSLAQEICVGHPCVRNASVAGGPPHPRNTAPSKGSEQSGRPATLAQVQPARVMPPASPDN